METQALAKTLQHIYSVVGSYTITLIATNNAGADTTIQTIVVEAIPVAVIGDYRDGGVVFWVDPNDNTHGLVCDINDLGTAQWGCYGTTLSGADGTAIGTGAQNTLDILNGCSTANIAADKCADNTAQGFTDWFLPSKDELNAMYQNKAAINTTAQANGGSAFASAYYWSSSEYNIYYAWEQDFYYGYQYNDYKDYTYFVRAIRAF